MSSFPTPESDRSQTLTAVLFMVLFAIGFFIIVMARDNIKTLVCDFTQEYDGFSGFCSTGSPSTATANSDQLVASKINSACVDAQGLKISVSFSAPVIGEFNAQIFSTGPDFFPSAQGMTDTYEMRNTITTAVDQLDFIIPVASMSEGEQIFGNIFVLDGEGIISQVAYLILVYDCSADNTLLPNGILVPVSDTPEISIATCLQNRQMMIAFEFDQPVLGQYLALVSNIPYQLASVVNQPAMLFFSGTSPPEELVVIKLVSATSEVVVFEETYNVPVCNPEKELRR